MNENLCIKATVTGKRQITIPKEICELLDIDNGKQVIFKTDGKNVIFEVANEYDTCFACNGSTKIENNECFVCNGTGKIDRNFANDIYKLVGILSINSRKYDVIIEFLPQISEFPIVKLKSVRYSPDELLKVQDEIQKIIIDQFSPKSADNNSLFCIPTDNELQTILDTLSTEKAKKEVEKWFRYERTIK